MWRGQDGHEHLIEQALSALHLFRQDTGTLSRMQNADRRRVHGANHGGPVWNAGCKWLK